MFLITISYVTKMVIREVIILELKEIFRRRKLRPIFSLQHTDPK
jgi:hypothetical protein